MWRHLRTKYFTKFPQNNLQPLNHYKSEQGMCQILHTQIVPCIELFHVANAWPKTCFFEVFWYIEGQNGVGDQGKSQGHG